MLTHEMTHQLAYNSGLQKRGVMYPLWVSEGLATFFEGSALPQWDPIGNTARRRTLAKLHAGGALLSLRELSVLAAPMRSVARRPMSMPSAGGFLRFC